MALFGPVFTALNEAGSRYVVVGGFATVLHGFARLTADVDLIVDLDPAEAKKTIAALMGLGFRARAPVEASTFADAAVRKTWIEQKGMRVFSLWDPKSPMREIDLFVDTPIAFQDLWARSRIADVDSTPVRIAGIQDLITLKRLAGRPQDLQDIEALEAIEKEMSSRD